MYGLLALSLIVIHRSSSVLNFAMGATGIVAAYAQWQLHDVHGWSSLVSVPVGVALSAVVGVITYRVAIRPLSDRSNLTRIVASLAVLIIIQGALPILYPSTAQSVTVSSLLPTSVVKFLGLQISGDRLWLLFVGAIVTMLGWLMYRFTRFGLATTAVSEHPLGLSSLGWNDSFIATANWGLGGAVSGLAMILIVPVTGLSTGLATSLLVPMIAAAVIGNLTSFPLAFLGGIVIAILQVESTAYINVSGIGDVVPFVLIVIMLTVSGRRLPLRSFINERVPRVSAGRIRWAALIPVLVGAIVVLLAQVFNEIWLGAITTTLVTAVVLSSLVVLIGFAGQASLAQLVIGGIAALLTVHLTMDGLGFWLAALLGVLAMIPLGFTVALTASRVRGISLAIVTLGLAVACQSLVFTNASLVGPTGVGLPLKDISLFGMDLSPLVYPGRYAVFVLIVMTLVFLVIANIRRGRAGRRLLAVRANERAAAALGIDVREAKIVAFVYASMIAGIGGILSIYQYSVATFSAFDPFTSITYVGYAVLGGVGYVLGALAGGLLPSGSVGNQAVVQLFPGGGDYIILVGGVLLLMTLLTQPDGIVPGNIAAMRGAWSRITRRAERPKAPEDAASKAVQPAEDVRRHIAPQKTLNVSDVSVTLGGVRILKDVSFSLKSGEVLGVIGPNGAGKTTLIDAVTGFVAMVGGDVTIDDKSVKRMGAAARARAGVTRSFQSLELFEDLTVRENLAVAADPQRRGAWLSSAVRPGKVELDPAVTHFVEALGLTPALDSEPSGLPHGRRRLISIARAAASHPSILLLDEPAAGLEQRDRDRLVDVIREIAGSYGVGVLLIEHDVQLVAAAADRMLCLDGGQQIAYGSPQEVLAADAVRDAYLGPGADEPLVPQHKAGAADAVADRS
jgi:sulfate-transporting ATPase